MTAGHTASSSDQPNLTGLQMRGVSWKCHFDAGALFLLAYMAFFLSSKMVGFTIGYALDDYGIVRQGGSESLFKFFLSQGRYSTALTDVILHASNLTMSSFSTIGLIATALFSGLFFKDALALPRNGPPMLAVGLGALLGSHPYYTEYVSFRQAALPMSEMFLCLWAALRLYRVALQQASRRTINLVGSLFAATLAMGINQLAVSYLAIAILVMEMQRLKRSVPPAPGSSVFGGRAWLKPIIRATLAGALLITCSMILAKLATAAFDITANQRAEILSIRMLSQRGLELWHLLPTLWVKSETVAGWPAKVTALMALLILLASSLRNARSAAWLSFATFIVGTTAALIPIAASAVWWPVPRTLIAVPFALAASIALLVPDEDKGRGFLAGILLIVSAYIFSAHSNLILSNQQRLNRWDQMQARDISRMALGKFSEHASRLAIVNSNWGYEVAREIGQGDLNISAMSVGWAVDPLFDEATGRDLSVRLAPELSSFCKSSPKYPDPASMHLEQSEVIVCMD